MAPWSLERPEWLAVHNSGVGRRRLSRPFAPRLRGSYLARGGKGYWGSLKPGVEGWPGRTSESTSCSSSAVTAQSTAGRYDCHCCSVRGPAITELTARCASTHAVANCASVTPFAVACCWSFYAITRDSSRISV